MRFVKETSTSGNLVMDAVVIDVSPDYFVSMADDGDDLRTEADIENVSIMEDYDITEKVTSPPPPHVPPRRRRRSSSPREISEKSRRLETTDSYYSLKENQTLSSTKRNKEEFDSEVFDDAMLSLGSHNKERRQEVVFSDDDENTATYSFDDALNFSGTSEQRQKQQTNQAETSGSQMYEDAKSTTRQQQLPRKQEVLDKIGKLLEPVLAVREALVNLTGISLLAVNDSTGDDNNSAYAIEQHLSNVEKILKAINTLSNEITEMENNESLPASSSPIYGALLKAITRPAKELFHRVAAIDARDEWSASLIPEFDAILESLIEPTNDIVTELSRIEHKIAGSTKYEKPIILERTLQSIMYFSQFLDDISRYESVRKSYLIEQLYHLQQVLFTFVNNVQVNQENGTVGNIDIATVEIIFKPLVEVIRGIKRASYDGTKLESTIESPIKEFQSRLSALFEALGNHYDDRHLDSLECVKTLVSSIDQEIMKMSIEKSLIGAAELDAPLSVEESAAPNVNSQQIIQEYAMAFSSLSKIASISQLFEEFTRICGEVEQSKNDQLFLDEIKYLDKLFAIELSQTIDPLFARHVAAQLSNVSLSKLLHHQEKDRKAKAVLNLLVKINDTVKSIAGATEETSSDVGQLRRGFTEIILDSIVEAQSMMNLSLAEAKTLVDSSQVTSSLGQLIKFMSNAAQAVITSSGESNIIGSLVEIREPLEQLQRAVVADPSTPEELSVVARIEQPVELMKQIILFTMKHSSLPEDAQRLEPMLQTIKDIEYSLVDKKTISADKFKVETAATCSTNRVVEDLTAIYGKLSSALQQNATLSDGATTKITRSVDTLNVAIEYAIESIIKRASVKALTVSELTAELKPLWNVLFEMEKQLLTNDHRIKDRYILGETSHELESLKAIVEQLSVDNENEVLTDLRGLIEDIQRDIPLIMREISAKSPDLKRPTTHEEAEVEKQNLEIVSKILVCINPISSWLNTTPEYARETAHRLEEPTTALFINALKSNVKEIILEMSETPETLNKKIFIDKLNECDDNMLNILDNLSQSQEESDILQLENLMEPLGTLKETFELLSRCTAISPQVRPILQTIDKLNYHVAETIEDQQQLAKQASFHELESTMSNTKAMFLDSLQLLRQDTLFIVEDLYQTMNIPSTSPLITSVELINQITTQVLADLRNIDEKAVAMRAINALESLSALDEALNVTQDYGTQELIILTRLRSIIENLEQSTSTVTPSELDLSSQQKLQGVLSTLSSISNKIPVTMMKITTRQESIKVLNDVLNPLKVVCLRMTELSMKPAEETLETDIMKLLIEPAHRLVNCISDISQDNSQLDKNITIIAKLQQLVEPLVELQSCFYVIQNSRRSSVPEVDLYEDRRKVILSAVDDLEAQVVLTLESIDETVKLRNTVAVDNDANYLMTALQSFNTAMSTVRRHLADPGNSRLFKQRSASTDLQKCVNHSFECLNNFVTALKEHTDALTLKHVSEPLETLQKQIEMAQIQLNQASTLPVDEEVIIEGFLYPANKLSRGLEALHDDLTREPNYVIASNTMTYLQVKLNYCFIFKINIFMIKIIK